LELDNVGTVVFHAVPSDYAIVAAREDYADAASAGLCEKVAYTHRTVNWEVLLVATV